MDHYKVTTLIEFIIAQQAGFPGAKGELSRILYSIGVAGKIINKKVNKAGLVDILGAAGNTNIQGEDQKRLDVFSDMQMIASLKASGEVCGVASEENDEIIIFDEDMSKDAKYLICMDPLDGSSNIDTNVSIGTIFSIYRRITGRGDKPEKKDFLQAGNRQVAAGYIVYGSSTMLVYTTGKGVNGFTLDPALGEFCLSHKDIKTPKGSLYSINEGNYFAFPEGVKKYIKYCQEEVLAENRPYTSRYIGSLVADFHRNLLKGGIFLYPQTTGNPKGKLRLLYECNPIAYISEQAGGRAITGKINGDGEALKQRVMDIEPSSIHQRIPYYVGSANMVDRLEEFLDKN